MFCSKCKKSFEEKYTFCPECGGELTEKKQKARLSKKALIIIIASAVLAATVALILILALSPKDKKEKAQKEDSAPAVSEEVNEEEEKEPEYKIMKSTREAAEKMISDIYPALRECFGDGSSYKGELSCDFDKMALKLLGYDLPEKAEIEYFLNACEGALSAELSASIGNNEPFFSATVIIDIIEGMIYVENDELLGGAYYIPLPLPGLEALGVEGERGELCQAIYDNFPKEEVLSELLAKYMTVLSDSLGEEHITDRDAEITLEEITQKGLCKNTVNINSKSLLSMIGALKKAISLDSLLRETVCELFSPIANTEKEETENLWKEGMKGLAKESELDTLIASLLGEKEIALSLWTDAYYDGVAFEAKGDSTLYIGRAKYGTDSAYCLSFTKGEESFSLRGKGEEKNSLFNGKIGVYDNASKLFDLTLKDFDFLNPLNGKASFKTARVVEIAFSASTDGEGCNASLVLSLLGYKPVKLSLTGALGEGESITPPEDAKGYVRLIKTVSDITEEDLEKLIVDGGFELSELERLIDDIKKLAA